HKRAEALNTRPLARMAPSVFLPSFDISPPFPAHPASGLCHSLRLYQNRGRYGDRKADTAFQPSRPSRVPASRPAPAGEDSPPSVHGGNHALPIPQARPAVGLTRRRSLALPIRRTRHRTTQRLLASSTETVPARSLRDPAHRSPGDYAFDAIGHSAHPALPDPGADPLPWHGPGLRRRARGPTRSGLHRQRPPPYTLPFPLSCCLEP